MKEIRLKKNVVSMAHSREDENNNDLTGHLGRTSRVDSKKESEFFNLTVRPLLAAGHESELVYFLRTMGIIRESMDCNNCNRKMKWLPSRRLDGFQWKCNDCNNIISIREASPFNGVKCSFKNIMLALFEWCKHEPVEETSVKLGIKKAVVIAIYQLAGTTIERSIKSNIQEWKMGGPGRVVLVDTFPEGCTSDATVSNKSILCLADLKGIPPILWLEVLETNATNDENITQLNKKKCLEVVEMVIHPESTVMVRRSSTLCSYSDLQKIDHQFKVLASNEGVSRHNNDVQNLSDNLSTIWEEALIVCEAAQFWHPSLVQNFLRSYMWRRKFTHESYQHLLNEISGAIQ